MIKEWARETAIGIIAAVGIIAFMIFLFWLSGTAYAAEPATQATPSEGEVVMEPIPENETWECIGEYKITHYCSCRKCCGKTAETASGAPLTRWRTIAMNGIPFGTIVYIEGYGYRVVEDRGPLGKKHIDVYTEDHQHALNLGVKRRNVYIVSGRTM